MTEQWEVIYDHGWHVVDVTDKRLGGQILICDCGIDPWSEMNAHKIAAAPELAEALKEARPCVEEIADQVDCTAPHKAAHIYALLARIDAALAKAGVK